MINVGITADLVKRLLQHQVLTLNQILQMTKSMVRHHLTKLNQKTSTIVRTKFSLMISRTLGNHPLSHNHLNMFLKNHSISEIIGILDDGMQTRKKRIDFHGMFNQTCFMTSTCETFLVLHMSSHLVVSPLNRALSVVSLINSCTCLSVKFITVPPTATPKIILSNGLNLSTSIPIASSLEC